MSILEHLLKEPFFNRLRTQEQLGYLVFSGANNNHGIEHLRFIIQSDKYSGSHLEDRINLFMNFFSKHLEEMSETDFQKNLSSVVAKKFEKDKNLWQESLRYWHEITSQAYCFNRDRLEGEYLKTISKAEVLYFFREHLLPTGNKVAKIASIVSTEESDLVSGPTSLVGRQVSGETCALALGLELATDSSDNTTGFRRIEVTDMDDFKRKMPLFPIAVAIQGSKL